MAQSKETIQKALAVERVSILGVELHNVAKREAIALIEDFISRGDSLNHPVFIVNAHTLNLAYENPAYARILNCADAVFGDGTGVCWAARRRSTNIRANLVGTDLIPQLFESTAGHGYRYFLLGGNEETIGKAAATCSRSFPGWQLAGFHHGYLTPAISLRVVELINAARPHLVLVGMGNPRQEVWIHEHRDQLRVPVAIGVGGLFDHWGGKLQRAPLWVRARGFEWLQLLLQQPHKWRRYLIGNPKFLIRMLLMGPRERSSCSQVGGPG